MKTEEIIKSLRCSASVHQEDEDCETCPYCCSEDLPEELAQAIGQNHLCSCDTDKIAMDAADLIEKLQERCIRYAEEAMELKARLKAYEEAERDGRLLVLPCGVDVDLNKNGHTFKADHWNHFLTAFRDAPETKSGKKVELFSIEEAEAALTKGGQNGGQ